MGHQVGEQFSHLEIAKLLALRGDEAQALRKKALALKREVTGNNVYFRGLI